MYGVRVNGGNKNIRSGGMKDKNWLKEKIDELNLVDTVFEYDGVSYIDTAVSVWQVYDLIDELDETERVVIPQFVADHIELCKSEDKRLSSALSESPESKMVFEMGVNWEEANEIYARAWLDGYEVGEEQKYYVLDSGDVPLLEKVGNQIQKTITKLSIHEQGRDNSQFKLTEQGIKDYDERFWAFAAKVE